MIRRAVRAVVTALACLLPFAASADSCSWFVGKDSASQVTVTGTSIAASFPAGDIQAVAMNGQDCGVWALGKTQLRRYDASGALALSVTLQTIDKRLDLATHIAVDPYDGSVWLAGDKVLAHLSSTGTVLSLPAFTGSVRGVAVGLDQSLSVLGDKQIGRFSAAGSALPAIGLKQAAASEAKLIAVDSVAGTIWVATNKNLLQLKPGQATPVSLRTSNAIVAIALEPMTGRLWLAEAGVLHVYDAAGTSVQAITLASLGLGSAENIAFDPAGNVLWVWTRDGVARLSTGGVLETFLPAQYGTGLLAVPGFWVQPRITLIEPPQDAVTNNARRLISIGYEAQCNGEPCGFAPSYLASYSLTAVVNGQQVVSRFVFNADSKLATYTPVSDWPQGITTFQAQVRDSGGRLSNSISAQFTVDTVAPVITVASPVNGAVTNMPAQTVKGSVNEAASVLVNNTSVSVSQAGTFTASVTLLEGANAINLAAVDRAGNTGNASVNVTLDTRAPAVPASGSVIVSASNGGVVTVVGAAGAVEGASKVVVSNNRTGASIVVTAAANGSFSAQIAAGGGDGLSVSATDAAGNQGPAANMNVPGGATPDPGAVATPIDPTVPTQMAASTAFLYSGANPVQTGVAPGTIDARRVAVLRGTVMSRDGQPLPGVTITVNGHPELGQTSSRADGMFDMAVNGGGFVTINYAKTGLLPAQRTATAPWQDFLAVADAVMVAVDTQATAVNLGAPQPQVARGSLVTDADGSRQATLIFPGGTGATVVMPDGSTRPLAAATVRATEYTVGPNGRDAMPGVLPATSGYTYAVEFSIDEAVALAAKEVRFDRPVISYVDNFLEFPVGAAVPAGYYDRDKAAWIAAPNGKVVKVLGVSNGLADLDVTGTGTAADATALAQLGIDEAERQKLGMLYQPGKSLWRVPVDHFTPWDFNWPYGPPPGAVAPTVPDPSPKQLENPDCKAGSIIECQNQSLGESVPVVGTSFSLNYKSSRTPGFDLRTISIPLSGGSLPASVKRIELEVQVAGTTFTQVFAATTNQITTFTWNGLDAFGRQVVGARVAQVRIGYAYDAVYRTAANYAASFALPGATSFNVSKVRSEVTVWKDAAVTLGRLPAAALGLGGWSLDVQHSYDPIAQALHRGDGSSRGAEKANEMVSTAAGTGNRVFSSAEGQALQLDLGAPSRVTVDAVGNVYFMDSQRVRKMTRAGYVTTVLGTGDNGFSEDGTLAVEAHIRDIEQAAGGIAVDAEGSLHFVDAGNLRVRKVMPDGRIKTIAGNGQLGLGGEGNGGPATQARLRYPSGLAIGPDGSVYFTETGEGRVRKVTPDGNIHTIAGGGPFTLNGSTCCLTRDGGQATAAPLYNPVAVAVDAQGNVYVADKRIGGSNTLAGRVRKISPNGVISTVAGTGESGGATCVGSGDGIAATNALLCSPRSLALDREGNLYIGTLTNVRKVTPDGIITVHAGRLESNGAFEGDGGPPRAARFNDVSEVAIDPSGVLYIADPVAARVRKIGSAFPAIDPLGFVIASDVDGQLFEFDANGRHVRTRSSLTGAQLYRFGYDPTGRLIDVTDGDGNRTQIQRDSQGKPAAIVAPDGQRTVLTVGSGGYLSAIANPAGETTRMAYNGEGLLSEFRRANGMASTMTYDAQGRLQADRNAAGGSWNLTRTDISASAFEVQMSTAMNRTNRYKVEKLPVGDVLRTNTTADGSITVVLEKPDGTTQESAADGTVVTTVEGPDPRFGMQAAYVKSMVVGLGSGLTNTVTFSRDAVLATSGEPLSLITLTQKTTLNGKTFTSTFDAAQRQYTNKSPLNRIGVVRIDAETRPLSAQIAGVEPVSYGYDSRGRISTVAQGSGADVRTAGMTYNAQGWLASATDATGRTVGYEYDAAGRVTRKTLPDNRVIGFTYDANGNVTSVTPPSRPSHGFGYTPVDLQQQYTPPAVAGIANPVTQYAYNLDKQLTAISRPDGKTVQLDYDSGGRLATVTAPHGATTYGYTPVKGTLASITAPNGVGLAYAYDGFLLSSETWTGAIAGSVARTYNNDFDLKTLNVAGTTYAFGYDNDRLLTNAGALTIGRDAANGFVRTTQLGGIATTQSYNPFGELQQYQVTQTGVTLLSQTYSYDKLGRITQKLETVQGQTDSYGYGFDPAGRLATVSKNGTAITSYAYDANGNRTSDGVNAARYDAQDRLVQYGSASYAYTDNGELKTQTVGGQQAIYDYDVMGNLRGVVMPDGKALEYVIDGRNRRIGKKVNGALVQGLLYQDQLEPVAELDASGVKARFVYGTKSNVPDYMEKGGKTYRIVGDHLGSVRLVVDASTGEVAQRMEYDAFGFVTQDSNPGFQPFGFAGGVYDQDTKFVRFGARDYDAITGKWTAKDPIGFNGGDSNVFAYVENKPLSYVDPLGLGPWDKLYGLPKEFWKWLHKEEGGELMKAYKDPKTGQIPKEDARELYEQWMRNKESGFVDPQLLEGLLLPWSFTPIPLAPGTLWGPGTPYPTRQDYDKAKRSCP